MYVFITIDINDDYITAKLVQWQSVCDDITRCEGVFHLHFMR